MVRLYGNAPYKIVLVHGGPGAIGSLKGFGQEVYLIQGESDPHPVKGVMIPLQENGVPCETYILEKCGHSPFMEKYAKDEFYKILMQIIKSGFEF